MTKVYIVTSGTYSDYTIDRVFLDKEKAERYIKLCDNHYWDTPQIEEFETDDDKSIDEIKYVRGVYAKNQGSNFRGKEMDVSIMRSNNLDDKEQNIKRNWFHKSYSGGYSLTIQRVIHGDFDEEKIIKKYEKALYDMMAQIEYLMSTGWDERMIEEWFEEKSDEYTQD